MRSNILALLFVLFFLSSPASSELSVLVALENHVGLVLLIASLVIIVLMALILLFLQNISEHLNWIRRVR